MVVPTLGVLVYPSSGVVSPARPASPASPPKHAEKGSRTTGVWQDSITVFAETCALIPRRSMASTSLRSSRSRRPGLATRSSTRNNVAVRPGSDKDKNAYITPQLANIGRKKRPRDDGLHEDLPLKAKRSKIAIEILQQQQQQPKAKPQPQTRSLAVKSRSNTNTRSDVAPLRSAPEQPEKSVTTTTTAPEPAPEPQKPTKHHLKVANGIRHEIDKLQPNPADLQCETRKLRSQEGTRFKSELSAYFPEYDEVIGNEPKEERKFITICSQLSSFRADLC